MPVILSIVVEFCVTSVVWSAVEFGSVIGLACADGACGVGGDVAESSSEFPEARLLDSCSAAAEVDGEEWLSECLCDCPHCGESVS